jgi:N-acetylglucosamine-6-sulfatase
VTRFGLLALAALVCALSAPAPPLAAQTARPSPRNVIFILSDDHRYDFMSFMPGSPAFLQTPAMDRMAKRGAHVQNAFVTTALCSPSRASILTGQYAHRHGIVDNITRIRPGTTFFPQLLQKAGYRTAYVGKWHMGEVDDGPQPGFDHWVSFRGQGTYRDPMLNINGKQQRVTGYTTDILTDQALEWLKQQTASASDAMSTPLRRGTGQQNQRKGGG